MTADAIKLLPCPFCGKAERVVLCPFDNDTWGRIECKDCGCHGPASSEEGDIRAKWNQRADIAPTLAEVAALREALAACELLIKYDEGDQEDSVQMMFDYANAVRAARKALRARALLNPTAGEGNG